MSSIPNKAHLARMAAQLAEVAEIAEKLSERRSRADQFFERALKTTELLVILGACVYVLFLGLSLAVGHMASVCWPHCGFADRIVQTGARAVKAVDQYWAGVLILMLPLFARMALNLAGRLKRFRDTEFFQESSQPQLEKPDKNPTSAAR